MSSEVLFRGLFDAHYSGVARYVLARGFQAADADDLIAATFEVAWRRLDRVPAGEGALPWLLAVARNLARNEKRKITRGQSFQHGLASVAVPAGETGTDGRAEWEAVRVALGQLRRPDRDLILLVAWDGLSPTQAGRVLGLRPVTARSRLHRARQRLAALLDQQGIAAKPASKAGAPPAATTQIQEEPDA
jgi:RNA polymerase sigma factor (sigma-70 family)